MNARTSEASLADAAARGIRIPPQPQVLLDLAELMATDDYDARRVAAVIGRDPGLAAMIFKVVHSPALRGTRPPASLEQAIMRIGVGQTLNIARAVALSTSVGDANRRAYELFWRRSRELAEQAALVADELGAVRSLVAILHLANHARLRAQRIHDYNWDRVGLEVLSELGLHRDDLNDYLADLQERGIGSPV